MTLSGSEPSANFTMLNTRSALPRESPERVGDQTVIIPFNNVNRSKELLLAHAEELAAVIVEPVLGAGGAIPATKEYLSTLRAICDRYEIVLIFDEMISLGMAPGGAQAYYDVTPDLTTAGKSIFAGMPQAFYGGRGDLMDLTGFGPDGEWPEVVHAGTYHSHPLAMAAGRVALELQDQDLFDDIAREPS